MTRRLTMRTRLALWKIRWAASRAALIFLFGVFLVLALYGVMLVQRRDTLLPLGCEIAYSRARTAQDSLAVDGVVPRSRANVRTTCGAMRRAQSVSGQQQDTTATPVP